MTILYIIGALILGSFLGYKFCKLRWRCEDMSKVLRLYIAFIGKEITIEYFHKEFTKILGE